ncbi:MAG TPA: peptidoglycan DD-metalloendopeptidase family protein [Gammaproteobacteria bacterium]|nr:peptidoglycan DD-metalloendopeptidase family protein [Gammaproteobacteria bacterium]
MNFESFIKRHRGAFAPIFDPVLTADNTLYMELSTSGSGLEGLDEQQQDAEIFRRIEAAGAIAGIGGYLENRSVYKDTDLFQGDAERSIHIGVDVFISAGTAIYVPFDGEVYSFANRQVHGDYGPVIILRHEFENRAFHTLYGHLSEASLDGLSEGRPVRAGEKFAEIGARPRNGNWVSHLHFQLIDEMGDYRGDYPGVVRPGELAFYRVNCPDPTPLLLS